MKNLIIGTVGAVISGVAVRVGLRKYNSSLAIAHRKQDNYIYYLINRHLHLITEGEGMFELWQTDGKGISIVVTTAVVIGKEDIYDNDDVRRFNGNQVVTKVVCDENENFIHYSKTTDDGFKITFVINQKVAGASELANELCTGFYFVQDEKAPIS